MMSCDQFLESISEFLDGELAPPLAEAARQHCLGCVRCRDLLASSRQMLGWAEAEGQLDMPAEASQRLRRALEPRLAPPVPSPLGRRPGGRGLPAFWRWRTSAASALVLLLLAVGIVRWRASATTLSGWLIDQGCAANFRTHADDHSADCLRRCAAKGMKLGLINARGDFEPFDAEGNRSARAIIQTITQSDHVWVTVEVRRASHNVLEVEHLALAPPPPGS